MPLIEYLKLMVWTIGLVTGSLVFTERVIRSEYSHKLGKGLTSFDLAEWLRKWPEQVTNLFNGIFGERHLTWRCFLASCVISYLGVLIILTSYFLFVSDSSPYESFIGVIGEFDSVLLGVLVSIIIASTNLLPDYISLLETRFVIRKIGSDAAIPKIIAFLVVDLLATAGIYLVVGYLMVTLIYFVFMTLLVARGDVAAVWMAMPEVLDIFLDAFVLLNTSLPSSTINESGDVGTIGAAEFLLYITYYTTFFTSVWVWLFAFAGFLLKFGEKVAGPLWAKISRKILDVEHKPLQSLAWVSGVAIVIIFVLASPLGVELNHE